MSEVPHCDSSIRPRLDVRIDYGDSTMRLQTLGGLALEGRNDRPGKPLLLSAYLAFEGQQARRRLAELFWLGAKDSMASLRVALSRLRSLDARLARSDGTLVWTEARTDAQDLLEALDRDGPSAADGYRGPFLQGVSGTWIGPELEEWILLTRQYLAARVRLSLLRSSERDAATGDLAAARLHAEKAATLVAIEEMEPEQLPRLHRVLAESGSPLVERAASLAREYGLDLASGGPIGRRGGGAILPSAIEPIDGLFVGRHEELDEIASLLADPRCRLVTVHGGGGVGKTRLARESALRAVDSARYPDGVRVIDLTDLVDPRSVPDRIAEALGLVLQARSDDAAGLADLLGDRRMLIVLDNFEHVLDAVSAVAILLDRCPHLDALITSRVRLGLTEEWTVPLEGLRLPDADVGSACEARVADAVRLFELRAQRLDRRFTLRDTDVDAVSRICRRVAGSPLAISLAASWLRALPPSELADELQRDIALLEQGGRDLPARHRGLRAAFDHSWRLLGERERTALRRLSVFRGGFRREAASAVAGATLPTLAHLVDASMVRALPSGRYDQHVLVRQFARERLANDATEEAATLARHADHYARLLRDASARTSSADFDRVFALLEEEEANMLACLEWAVRAGETDTVLALSDPLLWYFPMRSRFHEGARVMARAIAGLEGHDTKSREALSSLMLGQAFLTRFAGNLDEAMTLAENAERLARASSSTPQLMRAVDMLGQAVMFTGEYARASEYLTESVSLAREGHVAAVELRSLGNLVLAHAFAGDYDVADGYAREALALLDRRSVDVGFEAIGALLAIGVLRSCEANWTEARHVLRRADAWAQEVGYTGPASAIKAMLANAELELSREQGDAHLATSAAALVQEGAELAQSSGEAMALSLLHGVRARLALENGSPVDAERWAVAASLVAWKAKNTTILFYALPRLVSAWAAVGNPGQAARVAALMMEHPGAPRWVREYAQRQADDLLDATAADDRCTRSLDDPDIALHAILRDLDRTHRTVPS